MARTQFGAWLERQIEERDWTLTEAAKRVGLAQSNLSRYLNGEVVPGRKNLRRISEFFGVARGELEALIDADRPSTYGRSPFGYEGHQTLHRDADDRANVRMPNSSDDDPVILAAHLYNSDSPLTPANRRELLDAARRLIERVERDEAGG